MISTPALRSLITSELDAVVALRRDLHAHPELAYQEKRTSQVVSSELTKLGIAHVAGLAARNGTGGTGIVAFIPPTADANSARPSVAFRADMDALPIEENTGKPYSSTVPGVMHACGHDGHTANLVGLARVLCKLPVRPNPVTLIFQPAEEGGAGGKRMCEDGALDGSRIGTRVDRIFGLHGWPQITLGVVASKPGPMLAATDNFTVRIVGEQSHAAYPQLGRDPVVASAQIVSALQTICSRNVKPQDSIVVTVAMINGGLAHNIIPRHVEFVGTMRTLKPETRVLGKKRFYEIVQGVAAAMDCHAEIRWDEGYPVTHNDPGATERFFAVARGALGAARVEQLPDASLGGEDFSYYGQHVPACFFALGVKPEGAAGSPSLHQPEYDFNDDALATGIEVMACLAVQE